MKKLLGYARAACQKYDMIEDSDRVAVGVSGGKDSVSLLAVLAELRRFYPKKFELVAVTIDPFFDGVPGDYSEIAALCRSLDVEYFVRRTKIARIVFDVREEKNPCSLCSKLRRGAIHDAAKEAGCGKVALGHHLDDAAETFLTNLLNGGSLDCFSPKTYLSRKDLYVVRPFIFARESDCEKLVRKLGLPVIKNPCPENGNTERQKIKNLLKSLEPKYGDVKSKIIVATQKKGINGF